MVAAMKRVRSARTENVAVRPEEKLVACPLCKSRARLVYGRRGWFYSCIKWPTCRGTKPAFQPRTTAMIEGERGTCVDCGGVVLAATGKRIEDDGRVYYRHAASDEACATAVLRGGRSH